MDGMGCSTAQHTFTHTQRQQQKTNTAATMNNTQEGIAYYKARASRAKELGATSLHTFFTPNDGRSAHALITEVGTKNKGDVPDALRALDRGFHGE